MSELNKEDDITPKSSELGWKYHADFFRSLNRKVDETVEIAEQAHFNTRLINVYFTKVKNLYNKHASYIKDNKEIETELEKIGNAIFDKEYLEDLAEGIKNKAQIKLLQYKVITRLDKLFRQINKDCSASELFPKPINKYAAIWEQGKDSSMRSRQKAVIDIIFGSD